MREKRLNDAEKEFITLCLRFYKNKDEVRWSNLNKKIDRQQISRITKKFRKFGFINKGGYDINPKKLKEIKEILNFNEKQDNQQIEHLKEHHNVWDSVLPIVLILSLTGISFCMIYTSIHNNPQGEVSGFVHSNNTSYEEELDYCLKVRWNTTSCYEYFNRVYLKNTPN